MPLPRVDELSAMRVPELTALCREYGIDTKARARQLRPSNGQLRGSASSAR